MANVDDPVLVWLRELILKRGTNTAEVARKAELSRSRLRRVLAGSEPMLVDELVRVTQALELSSSDVGLPELGAVPEPELAAPESEAAPEGVGVDPFGNHAKQLFEVAYQLGCTFRFSARIDALQGSGVPDYVLSQYQRHGELVLQIDAAHHGDSNPRIGDDDVVLTLSFDDLYDCTIPWSAIVRVAFEVEPDEPPESDEPSDDVPHLRLVT